MSLNSYINTLRIAKAAALIRGGAPITEAALEAGFQSVRTFHDVYRRMQNAAPRKLKN
jgi:AraC-like DNA-binding protein